MYETSIMCISSTNVYMLIFDNIYILMFLNVYLLKFVNVYMQIMYACIELIIKMACILISIKHEDVR